jgi:hypothetical protein
MLAPKDGRAYRRVCMPWSRFSPRCVAHESKSERVDQYAQHRIDALLALGACSAVSGREFRNEQTGELQSGCGPMQGFTVALDRAQQGCTQSFENNGWTQLGPV